MRAVAFFGLLVIVTALPSNYAAPAPKRTNAKPAVIDARNEQGIRKVSETIEKGALVGIRENKEAADLLIVHQQKDLQTWVKKNLRVERVKEKNLVQVSFKDGNAKEQAAIINAVVKRYLTDVSKDRDRMTRSLQEVNDRNAALKRAGKLTQRDVDAAEVLTRKIEPFIGALPALVEKAKAP